MKTEDLTFDFAQRNQPWVHPYAERHQSFVSDFRSPFMVNHCVLHITKALGKIAGALEETDHSNLGPVPSDANVSAITNAVADIVASCLKICAVYGCSLAHVLARRVREKNGIGFDGK
jgi:hypothetical protein